MSSSNASQSKLDYLSKYLASGGTNGDYDEGDDDYGRKKKKSSKKKKDNKKKKSKPAAVAVRVAAYDEDDDRLIDDDNDSSDKGLDDVDEEDRPVVVNSMDTTAVTGDNGLLSSSQPGRPRGVWSTVKKNEQKTAVNEDNQRRRYDSDESDSDEHPSKRQRRRRHDSSSSDDDDDDEGDDDHDDAGRKDSSAVRNSRRSQEQRHDSDSDSEKNKNSSARRPRRQRHDSDESSDDGSLKPKQRKLRHDSEDESGGSGSDEEQKQENHHRRRQRHDSEDSSSDDIKSSSKINRMSSGHKAGLQDYTDFNKSERKIQERKNEDAKRMVDKYGMGETVYRDQHGRKKEGEAVSSGGPTKKVVELDADAQRRLNEGTVQQNVQRAKAEEMAILRESSFARYQDDGRLEDIRKNEIRDGDPMAKYASKKSQKKRNYSTTQQEGGGGLTNDGPTKPTYKGPPPKPNRYGICPGYRWDGIDRGNGFEDKLLAQKYSANLKKEEAYRWRSADM